MKTACPFLLCYLSRRHSASLPLSVHYHVRSCIKKGIRPAVLSSRSSSSRLRASSKAPRLWCLPSPSFLSLSFCLSLSVFLFSHLLQTCHKGHCWPLTFVDGYRVSYCRCTLGYAGAACEKSVLPGWYIDFLVGILVLSNLAFLFVIKSSLRDFVEATHAHRAQRERLLVVKNNRDERRTESSEEANNKREETRHQEDQEDEESQAGEQRTRETGEDLAVLQDIHEELQRSRDARWRAFLRVMIFGTASKNDRRTFISWTPGLLTLFGGGRRGRPMKAPAEVWTPSA